MTSSCRDRTSELVAIVERLKKSATNSELGHGRPDKAVSSIASAGGALSEFNKRASRIGLSIHQTSEKLGKLTRLAKRTSMFDDPAVEIQELTAVIKQDITALNDAIADLQNLCDTRSDGNRNKHTSEHSTTVVDNLKSRLMTTTKEFKDVLTLRTENLKVHENRRKLFSTSPSGLPPLSQGRLSSTSIAPAPWEKANGAASSKSASQLFSSSINQKKPGSEFRQSLMQQELTPYQDGYMNSRTEALQNVESTIVELSNIFKDLATMVAQQGEMAIRIDQDIDDALANVEGAQGALLKYLNKISSNKWLIIKIFFILIVFLLIFVVFVA